MLLRPSSTAVNRIRRDVRALARTYAFYRLFRRTRKSALAGPWNGGSAQAEAPEGPPAAVPKNTPMTYEKCRRPIVRLLVACMAVSLALPLGATPASSAYASAGHAKSTKKIDPYKKYAYRVRFGSSDVAGFTSVSTFFGLPGKRTVTMDSGLSKNLDFETWANGVNDTATQITSRSLTVVQMDSSNHPQSATQYFVCWPRQYVWAPASGKNTVYVQTLRLQCNTPTQGVPVPAPSY